MLNDARVASIAASFGFFKDNVCTCTTRINKEKKFKIKFQVLLKSSQILPDYYCQQLNSDETNKSKKKYSNRHFSVAPYITICPSTKAYFELYLRGAMS